MSKQNDGKTTEPSNCSMDSLHEYAAALTKSLEVFVSYTEKAFDDVMSKGLYPIAEAADLDRIIVFRIFGLENNSAGEVYRWDKAEGGTAPIDPELKTLQITKALKHWISFISNDSCIKLRRSEFTKDEAAFLDPRGVKSILIMPVFIERKLWGVVTFHDNINERDFDADCISLLRSTARLCAATIIQDEKSKAIGRTMNELKRQETLKDTLNKAAVIFLSQQEKKFEVTMTRGISLIAETTGIDRLVIYRNRMAADGLHMVRIYRWDRGSNINTELIESYSDIPYSRLTPDWNKHLADDNIINSPSRMLSEIEATIFKSVGIVSAVAIPVFINKEFWGFGLFGDLHNERYFELDLIEMMRSAVFLFANAFIRTEMEDEISDENELNRVMFEAAPIGLTTFDENLHPTDCNNAVLNMYGVAKQHYLDHFLDFSPEYQSDGQKTIDKMNDIIGKALKGERQVTEWMHKKPSGEAIPCELVLTRVKYKGKYIGLGYVYDLRHIKEMEKNIQLLETEADKIYYDALTGIHNRRYFDENLKRILKSLSRSRGTLSLIMIDIDLFKNYNDTYGHSKGDKCLKAIAETLSNTITRADDFVARYGGEEFAIVLPNTGEKGARMIAVRLLENIRKCNIPHEKSDVANHVTISIGATSSHVKHTHSEENYIQRADEALYKSKQEGRDRFTFMSL